MRADVIDYYSRLAALHTVRMLIEIPLPVAMPVSAVTALSRCAAFPVLLLPG
jgi:hypothetical protein